MGVRPDAGRARASSVPLLGTFAHEAAAVDPVGKAVYLTEDEGDSRLYRFLPDAYPDLSSRDGSKPRSSVPTAA